MHPFHGEERGQIGGERGQHEHDEHPVRGDQNASADGFRSLTTPLWGERRQREPETLDQREIPARIVRYGLWLIHNELNSYHHRRGVNVRLF